MKAFMYLYPVKQIFDYHFKQYSWMFKGEKLEDYKARVLRINEFIDAYRQKGYTISYVLFSKAGRSQISEFIKIREDDKIIDAGITFEELCSEHPKYADEDLLLNSFKGLEELIVAGFHCHDCVKRVSDKAKISGIKSKRDIALTENFFFLIKYSDDIYAYMKKVTEEMAEHYSWFEKPEE